MWVRPCFIKYLGDAVGKLEFARIASAGGGVGQMADRRAVAVMTSS